MMMLEAKWVATGLVKLGASCAFLLGLGEFIVLTTGTLSL